MAVEVVSAMHHAIQNMAKLSAMLIVCSVGQGYKDVNSACMLSDRLRITGSLEQKWGLTNFYVSKGLYHKPSLWL